MTNLPHTEELFTVECAQNTQIHEYVYNNVIHGSVFTLILLQTHPLWKQHQCQYLTVRSHQLKKS